MLAEGPVDQAPWSLAAILTQRDLCLWLAYLALFYVGVHLAKDPRRVDKFAQLCLVTGIVLGAHGIGQWLLGLRELMGTDPTLAGIRATSLFGNPNHYAAFMEILLLVSVGWIGARLTSRRADRARPGPVGTWRRATSMMHETTARLLLFGLGWIVLGLGLVFSLSRSGIAAALTGLAAFALFTRSESTASRVIELERRKRSGGATVARPRRRGPGRRWLWALALVVLGFTFWIGVDPVIQRFEQIPDLWESERGRQQVWSDGLQAVNDFWLTGSGLGSFQYVFPIYRSFGGRVSYFHAHNDYLQLLIELGVPGLILLGWIVAAVAKGARRARHRLQSHLSSLLLHAGYCAALVATAFHGFTDFSLHLPAIAALASVVVGVVVGFDRSRLVETSQR
jgi:O-antigen ligase